MKLVHSNCLLRDPEREQGALFLDHLEDFVSEENPVRAVDVFVDSLD